MEKKIKAKISKSKAIKLFSEKAKVGKPKPGKPSTSKGKANKSGDAKSPVNKPSGNKSSASNSKPMKLTKSAQDSQKAKNNMPAVSADLMAYISDAPCALYKTCGGCHLQHLTYEGQLISKQKTVDSLLKEFCKVSPIIGMENPLHYRNKVNSTFSQDKRGQVISGIYEEESHRVVSVEDCMIQNEEANAIIKTVKRLMPSFKMMPYDEDRDRGFLRHVMIRTGFESKEIMVVLVAASLIFPSKNNFVKALLKAHPNITTIVLNINNRRTSMILGANEMVLHGPGFIEDTLCDTVFKISPKSFYQVNPIQTEILYKKAIEFANLKGAETILDAYCGIGTIGLIASKHAEKVVGVELNQDAVHDAISNAKRNGIKNARFYQGDAGEFMLQVSEDKEHLDVVFMDPPRSGCDEKFLSSLVKLAPKTVVYVSCNPESLASDLKYLVKNGYKVKGIQPVDMFPWTGHVECVVRIQRKESMK